MGREGWQNGYCTGLENRRPQGLLGSSPRPSVASLTGHSHQGLAAHRGEPFDLRMTDDAAGDHPPHGQTGTPSLPVGALTAPTHSEHVAPLAIRVAVARQPLPLASSIVTSTPGDI